MNIECNSNNIQVTLDAPNDFNGMIYPKGLSKNSTCMAEYTNVRDKIVYTLPLRSCNTMSTDVVSGHAARKDRHRRLKNSSCVRHSEVVFFFSSNEASVFAECA